MKILLAQRNFLVGDIQGNTDRILADAAQAVAKGADLIVFPELALTGYPPEDLLLRPEFLNAVDVALNRLQAKMPMPLLVGYPAQRNGQRFNMAGLITSNAPIQEYAKQCLPNYREFDEKRYFTAGNQPSVFQLSGYRIGISICEDIWFDTPIGQLAAAGADFLINLSASPFRQQKHRERLRALEQRASKHQLPILYCNLVGGQDELVFDGGSLAVDASGKPACQAPFFESALWPVEITGTPHAIQLSGQFAPQPDTDAAVWQSLVLALRDYVRKNGFSKVLMGLSGGIDSALVLALAAEALGPENVTAVMMPYHYTAQASLEDAEAEANALGVDYQIQPIADFVTPYENRLAEQLANDPHGITAQNLQARSRGLLLMALSNQHRALVLATGNKSEMAMGYATLYGDMAGAFSPIKDIYKTHVYALARFCNQKAGKPIIPERVITRPPSAELAPDQTDQDNLPDYDLLDTLLERHLEHNENADKLVQAGFDADTVQQVLKRIRLNEFKRRQAAPGPCITQQAFGRDRRFPITNGWKLEGS